MWCEFIGIQLSMLLFGSLSEDPFETQTLAWWCCQARKKNGPWWLSPQMSDTTAREDQACPIAHSAPSTVGSGAGLPARTESPSRQPSALTMHTGHSRCHKLSWLLEQLRPALATIPATTRGQGHDSVPALRRVSAALCACVTFSLALPGRGEHLHESRASSHELRSHAARMLLAGPDLSSTASSRRSSRLRGPRLGSIGSCEDRLKAVSTMACRSRHICSFLPCTGKSPVNGSWWHACMTVGIHVCK